MKYTITIDPSTKVVIFCSQTLADNPPLGMPGHEEITASEEIYSTVKRWINRQFKDQTDCVYDAASGAFNIIGWPVSPGEINKTTALANSIDTISITGLANPTRVSIPGIGKYTVEDGGLNLTFDLAGIYSIYLNTDRHTNKIFQVTVT